MPISVVILAAGKGTRMRSDLPKVLHPIAKKPMVQHVIDTVKQLAVADIHLVYGHGAEQLKSRVQDEQLNWVYRPNNSVRVTRYSRRPISLMLMTRS